MYSPRQECNRARRRIEFVIPRSLRVEEEGCYLDMLPRAMKFLGDSSNRTVNVEPSWAAVSGQQTRCHRNGTSGSQLPAFSTREGHSKKGQNLLDSVSRAPLFTELRRTRIPARALDTGVEPLLESLFLKQWFFRRLQIQSIDGIRFRASLKKAARLAYLAACLTDFSGDPPQDLDEDAKALTSRFHDLLHIRRLSDGRAACGDPLGNLQQHGATLGNSYYRCSLIASMRRPKPHILSNHLPATLWRRAEFLPSLHRQKRPVSHHNVVEFVHKSVRDWLDRATPVESIPQTLEEKTLPWIVGLDGNQIISLFTEDHQPFFTITIHGLVSDIVARSRPDEQSTYPPIYYGTVASGNQLVESSITRDYWRDEEGLMCFEMEVAGLMLGFPYLIIQGICDYAGSDQEPRWRLRSERLRFFFWWENDSTSRYSSRPAHLAPSLLIRSDLTASSNATSTILTIYD